MRLLIATAFMKIEQEQSFRWVEMSKLKQLIGRTITVAYS